MNTVDILLMAGYFIIIIGIGLIGARKAKTSEDFMVAGRSLGLVMYLACLAAVILGGASTIGTARLGYEFGISGIWLVVMIGIGIILLGIFLVKKVSRFKIITISELLGLRFNSQTRVITSLITFIYVTMITVTQVIGMGTILNVLLGWDIKLCMLLGGSVVVMYTLLGGMWSVTMTDIFQFIVMTIGVFAIMLPLSLDKAGGWSALQEKLPHSYFEIANIGGDKIFSYFLLYCLGVLIGQDIWQRIFTAKTVGIAKKGTIGAGVYCLLYAVAISIIGMCAAVVFPNLSDPQSAFITMAITILPVGLLGIVIASVVSALMSTASATLLASSTLIVNDIIKSTTSKNMSEKAVIRTSRILTLIIGIFVMISAVWIQDVIVALDVAYAILSGSVFFPIILGLFWKRVTDKAAFYSIILSAIVTIVGLIVQGLSATDPILYGMVCSVLSIFIISYLTSPEFEKYEEWKEQHTNADVDA
ncbi:sodium:solute symporter [Bacillus cereus]|uniref:Sodium:solute symporter n=1 Tax=Bacillus nitratireducens TaxID=2026193 RepID=A0ABU6PK52_9BACI|nr:sodium:solute symporter [Bacillus nitratireducens]EEL87156.1 Na+/solute symporter [Bacillus cereus AH1272]EEL92995.1 Na+/solute symporter [Bacillus cereus AH1273]EOO76685.1 solute:sodium symporter (SSS) family transporter [Bacillus cereus BAG1O-1]EOP53876.1 solute:sodium symporter (SSS) family transporter [Bacillus cereus VDM053]PEB78416.1 sodium:solute symporter [Bacillus cereus]